MIIAAPRHYRFVQVAPVAGFSAFEKPKVESHVVVVCETVYQITDLPERAKEK